MRPEPQRLIDRREFPILYVDDEKENLRAFELTFRREYEVHTAESGREALEIINSHPIAVVLSDHRMPEMTGTELLNRVRTLDPRTIRLLVTAYGDAETLADAVNNGSIYRYIPKPWNLDEMRQVLSQAVDLYALESERESLLSELTTLRSVSHELAAELDLGRLGELVVSTVVEGLGFDGASLFLASAGRSVLRGIASLPRGGQAVGLLMDLELHLGSGSALAKSLTSGETVLLAADRSGEDPVVRKLMTEVAADEILCVPLQCSGRLVGALLVDNRRGGKQFLAAARALLEGLAAQVAIAVANAQVVSRLQEESSGPQGGPGLTGVAGAGLLLRHNFMSIDLLRRFVRVLTEGAVSPLLVEIAEIAEALNAGFDLPCDGPRVSVVGDGGAKVACDKASLVVALGLLVAWYRSESGSPIRAALRAEEGGNLSMLLPESRGLLESLLSSGECSSAAAIVKSTGAELRLTEDEGRIRVDVSTC